MALVLAQLDHPGGEQLFLRGEPEAFPRRRGGDGLRILEGLQRPRRDLHTRRVILGGDGELKDFEFQLLLRRRRRAEHRHPLSGIRQHRLDRDGGFLGGIADLGNCRAWILAAPSRLPALIEIGIGALAGGEPGLQPAARGRHQRLLLDLRAKLAGRIAALAGADVSAHAREPLAPRLILRGVVHFLHVERHALQRLIDRERALQHILGEHRRGEIFGALLGFPNLNTQLPEALD